jgi:hypothetical protein
VYRVIIKCFPPSIEYKCHIEDLPKKSFKNLNLLYLNPKVQVDDNGEAYIRFEKSAEAETIRVKILLITPEGNIESLFKKVSL